MLLTHGSHPGRALSLMCLQRVQPSCADAEVEVVAICGHPGVAQGLMRLQQVEPSRADAEAEEAAVCVLVQAAVAAWGKLAAVLEHGTAALAEACVALGWVAAAAPPLADGYGAPAGVSAAVANADGVRCVSCYHLAGKCQGSALCYLMQVAGVWTDHELCGCGTRTVKKMRWQHLYSGVCVEVAVETAAWELKQALGPQLSEQVQHRQVAQIHRVPLLVLHLRHPGQVPLRLTLRQSGRRRVAACEVLRMQGWLIPVAHAPGPPQRA